MAIVGEYMPKNCSSDVQAVIACLDQIYAENNMAAMQSLKAAFGLGYLSHIDEFAAARMSLIDLDGMTLITDEHVNLVRFNLFDWRVSAL